MDNENDMRRTINQLRVVFSEHRRAAGFSAFGCLFVGLILGVVIAG